MKVLALIVSAFISSAHAAPAIVWSNEKTASESVVHSSQSVKASALLSEIVTDSDDSSLAAAVFLVGRAEDGTESLSGFASSGSLPLVASKYDDATTIHSHVAGIESPFSVARDAGKNTGRRVLQVTLSEFSSKLTSLGQKEEKATVEVDENGMVNKAKKRENFRAKALSEADVVIVNVPASSNPAMLDAAVAKAVEHKSVGSVVLAGVRSTSEVKVERTMTHRRKMMAMEETAKTSLAGRRLEDANNGDDDANNNNGNNDDMSGVYYVHMTPNILAGVMFAFLFAVVTFTGLSCMGMIEGQDVYVTKMPTIGREA